MSFILDALRKSEHERQRQVGPGIVDIRAATARPGLPMWAMVLGGLLLVNVLVVIALTLRGRSAEPGTAAVIAPKVESPTPPATSVAAVRPVNAPARAPAVAASRVLPPPISTQPSQASSSDTASPTTRADEPTLRPSPRPSAAEESVESYARLPTIGDVSLQNISLPELHLDLHVYASRPADRFVFLNTRKYREGGQTPDGTTIERITPDGVILNHHGVRFLLPRQ